MRITLLPYVSEWPVVYEYEKFLLLRGTNQPGIQIEHIGSTAIPGLPAKPVIDVMLGVPQGFPLDLLIETIIGLDYCYIRYYDQFVPESRFFVRVEEGVPQENRTVNNRDELIDFDRQVHSHHLYVTHIGSKFWKDRLRFRDHLRNNSSDRLGYGLLKKQLASSEWESEEAYTKAKAEFIQMILSRPSSIL